jgi:hypothetical protein
VGSRNQTDFYRIPVRLISTENKNSDNEGITIIIDRSGTAIDKLNDAKIARSSTTM